MMENNEFFTLVQNVLYLGWCGGMKTDNPKVWKIEIFFLFLFYSFPPFLSLSSSLIHTFPPPLLQSYLTIRSGASINFAEKYRGKAPKLGPVTVCVAPEFLQSTWDEWGRTTFYRVQLQPDFTNGVERWEMIRTDFTHADHETPRMIAYGMAADCYAEKGSRSPKVC